MVSVPGGLAAGSSPGFIALILGGAVIVSASLMSGLGYLLTKLEPSLEAYSIQQDAFLTAISESWIDIAIAGSAAVSLFLELAIIRWQGTVFEFFAFYKNFGLLACFVGLGLGYALADRGRVPLILTIPLLAWQFTFMTGLRYGLGQWGLQNIRSIPFREQLNMGVSVSDLTQGSVIYFLLGVVFLLTVSAFLPIGQLCGRLMEQRPKLRSYGLNLAGSLFGVAFMFLASSLWTPPLVWFSLSCLGLLIFHLRKSIVMISGAVFTIFCLVILAWPVDPLWNRIYSPYQMLEVGVDNSTGLTLIRAAGHYYQRVNDFGATGEARGLQDTLAYYQLPYRVHPVLDRVAIVGAGTGNDVAAALKRGASHIDAIEIDPAILEAGKVVHPNKPYGDPRVNAVVNDARSFLRTTPDVYDLIVYGLLDSHTLLSQASSVRLDSFVYTVEGLREARSRLKDDGLLSLSFTVLNPNLGRKIYLMLQDVFDGRPPVCVMAPYDLAVIFLESNDKNWTIPRDLVARNGFRDVTSQYSNSAIEADLSTDDWPFFYMPRRVYPISYLLMIGQILLLVTFLIGNFTRERPQISHISFFCLGAGFMLVETKGVTEMGLTFGNTWQVTGIVIASILIMAFFGNCLVSWLKIRKPTIPYLFLFVSLGFGWYISKTGGFSSTGLGRIESAAVLTCPLLFSGMVFSSLLSAKGKVAGIMAANLLGALVGGLVEYNSMYFGFRSLYLIAIGFYIMAFLSDLRILTTTDKSVVYEAG